MKGLENKRVVISAAATGIGRATAEAFLAAGAKLHVCDVDGDGLAALKATYPAVGTTVADVAAEDQVERFIGDALKHLGGIDVLVNNAGIAGPTANLEDCSPEDWRRTLAVNLDGAYLCSRRAIPVMKRAQSGSIVNLSSSAGIFGFARRTPYASAKWAIVGLTKSLALELGPFGIRVNCICPGPVEGDRIERVIAAEAKASGRSPNEVRDSIVRFNALKTFISPQDIANMIVFLCSTAGARISGQALPVDGYTYTLGE
ncbi:MAG TPA: SDR family oxidoreductase [Dongiaceae bacterium]|jgi:NAD(P)-dependent dehydrogenase (short-subunit alcohol dehydrogenase family)